MQRARPSLPQPKPWQGIVYSIGLSAVIIPSIMSLIRHDVAQSGDSQSLFVIGIAALMLAHRSLDLIRRSEPCPPSIMLKLSDVIFGIALISYAMSRAYDVLPIEIGSVVIICWIVFYQRFGQQGIRAAWFPLLFLGFSIPMPGLLLNVLTLPLKTMISSLATLTLRGFDYPIARTGVTLYVAQHQLLVEDACAGLNTLFSLVALSCFYVYISRPTRAPVATILLLIVLPVALLANFTRVILLILITYYAGNDVAQSFVHQLAGLVIAAIALGTLFGADAALRAIWRQRT